jgi:hypothetical protein
MLTRGVAATDDIDRLAPYPLAEESAESCCMMIKAPGVIFVLRR